MPSVSVTQRAPTTLPLRSLGDDGADADAAAVCLAEIFDQGAFAEAIFADDKDRSHRH